MFQLLPPGGPLVCISTRITLRGEPPRAAILQWLPYDDEVLESWGADELGAQSAATRWRYHACRRRHRPGVVANRFEGDEDGSEPAAASRA